jgi:hypothetical protein
VNRAGALLVTTCRLQSSPRIDRVQVFTEGNIKLKMDFQLYQAPPCPKCGGEATAPNRMGMSQNNCLCGVCGEVFNGRPDPAIQISTKRADVAARCKSLQHCADEYGTTWCDRLRAEERAAKNVGNCICEGAHSRQVTFECDFSMSKTRRADGTFEPGPLVEFTLTSSPP